MYLKEHSSGLRTVLVALVSYLVVYRIYSCIFHCILYCTLFFTVLLDGLLCRRKKILCSQILYFLSKVCIPLAQSTLEITYYKLMKFHVVSVVTYWKNEVCKM